MRRFSTFVFALVIGSLLLEILPSSAATDIILRRGSGTVGYRTGATTPLITVTGEQTVADNAFAQTGPASLGIVVFPDSSLVRLGENSEVQIGAFKQAEQGSGSTIKVGSRGGTVRFQIRHPAGAKSSYNFDTSIMNIAVRGTTALLADGPEGDVLTCLDCSAGDVVVTIAGKQYALLTGQTMVVTPNGKVSVDSTSDAVLGQFRTAGLSTTLGPDEGVGPAGARPPSGAIVPVAGVIIAGLAVALGHGGGTGNSNAVALPTPTPAPTSTAAFGPVILTPGSVSISSANRTATVTASQTGNTANSFSPSSPTVVCSNGGSASVSAQLSTITVSWIASTTTQTCAATISGQGGLSNTISINLGT